MGRMTAAHAYTLQLVADGQWHDYEKVRWEAMKGVPPNLAIRKAEENRVAAYLHRHPGIALKDVPPRRGNQQQDAVVRIGSRHIVNEVLANTAFQHAMDPQGNKWVRRRPKGQAPLPEGWTFWRKEPEYKWGNLTPEEREKKVRESALNATKYALARHGITYDENYETARDRRERRRREWEALSEEERQRIRSEKSKKAARTRLLKKGIDPDTFLSKEQRAAQRRAEFNALPPEEKAAIRAERGRRGWATRLAKQQQKERDG